MISRILSVILGYSIIMLAVAGRQYVDDRQSAFDTDFGTLTRASVYFLLMLFGLFASERYKYFNADLRAGRNFFANISYAYLYRAILVSPIVFAAVITFVGKDANIIMASIFAFQNGFFWETVFSSRAAQTAQSGEHLTSNQADQATR